MVTLHELAEQAIGDARANRNRLEPIANQPPDRLATDRLGGCAPIGRQIRRNETKRRPRNFDGKVTSVQEDVNLRGHARKKFSFGIIGSYGHIVYDHRFGDLRHPLNTCHMS